MAVRYSYESRFTSIAKSRTESSSPRTFSILNRDLRKKTFCGAGRHEDHGAYRACSSGRRLRNTPIQPIGPETARRVPHGARPSTGANFLGSSYAEIYLTLQR